MLRHLLCHLLMMCLCVPAIAGHLDSSIQNAANITLVSAHTSHNAATESDTDIRTDCHQEEVQSAFNHDKTHSTEDNTHDCCDIESTDCERPCHQAHTFSAVALTQTRDALSFRPVREHLQIVVAATPAHKNQPDRPPRFVS